MMMMMDNSTGFSSPKGDAFPAGLRVLVVDDDPTWLKILEKMLKKCNYEVTTCGLAREALDLLRERKDGFDIVISDVNMPDMDGFKLLEHVGLEMDLPVIMMSVDGETSRVMKGVQHGACDYLLKPIRMKELRNIWQHVFRKRIHEVRDIEFHEGMDEIHMLRNGSELYEDRHLPCGSDLISGKKRKDIDNKHDDRECNDPSSVKKTRVVWTVELHQKFVHAVHQIGYEKVGPKKILDMMGVPWLTRENVASHLQKYRLYLARLQKEKELTASFGGGMKHSDISSKEANGNHCSIQSITNKQHCDLSSSSSSSNYSTHGNKIIMQNIDFKIHEGGDIKCPVSMPSGAEPKKAPSVDASDPKKSSSTRMSLSHSFGQLDSDMNYATTIPIPYSWDEECSQSQVSREYRSDFQPKSSFNHLPLTNLPQSIQVKCLQTTTLNPKPSIIERDKLAEGGTKAAYAKGRSQGTAQLSPLRRVEMFPTRPVSKLTDDQAFKSNSSGLWNTPHYSLDQILEGSLESVARSQNLASGLTLVASWDDNPYCKPLQGGFQPENIVPEIVESLNYSSSPPGITAEVPSFLYDSPFEYPFESVSDQGLFIT